MNNLRHNLFRQFVSIGIILFGIVFLSLGLVLPRVLLPIYEKNIYNYLKQPLEFIDYESKLNNELGNVAYIFTTPMNNIIVSENFNEVININPNKILENIKGDFGKTKVDGKIIYYYKSIGENISKIAIIDDTYINQIKKDVLLVILPIILITMAFNFLLIITWTRRLVLKIYYLKEKIANINHTNYEELYKNDHLFDDELNALSEAIDDMHTTLKAQEEYKNQMYQSISHDFKTPITVIKSYMEAIDDGISDMETGKKIINEQVEKLENKVHSLLYLNKISYLKDHMNFENSEVKIKDVVKSSVDKFRYQKPDINWEIKIADNDTFMGTFDLWEAIIDNIFNNFIRYAEKKITVTVKKGMIVLYNDGPNIEESLINDIFNPYKKGIHGKFGLGLSIIKKSLCLVGYGINIRNEKKGVTFTISLNEECKREIQLTDKKINTYHLKSTY